MCLYWIKLKMDQQGHRIDQKGLKMCEKRQTNRDKKTCFLAKFSLAELGGTPVPPLKENDPAPKTLAERGGTPPPLTDKIR